LEVEISAAVWSGGRHRYDGATTPSPYRPSQQACWASHQIREPGGLGGPVSRQNQPEEKHTLGSNQAGYDPHDSS